MTDCVVLHEKIGRRHVCAIGAMCGDEPVIAIGVADDDDDDHREQPKPQARARRAGLRALRKLAAKAAPIVTAAVPGGAAAREAAKLLLESRRAAAEVETQAAHPQAVTGLLSPLAARVVGQVEEPPPPHVVALLAQVNTLNARELRPLTQQIRRALARGGRIGIDERARLERQLMPVIERFARLEDQLLELGWGLYLTNPEQLERSAWGVERLEVPR